ncbi:MAG TPA: hypothetical protein VN457_04740 [Chlamydiales bacterium]|nr:hypothetical protein [Chlamydiales bacterium]
MTQKRVRTLPEAALPVSRAIREVAEVAVRKQKLKENPALELSFTEMAQHLLFGVNVSRASVLDLEKGNPAFMEEVAVKARKIDELTGVRNHLNTQRTKTRKDAAKAYKKLEAVTDSYDRARKRNRLYPLFTNYDETPYKGLSAKQIKPFVKSVKEEFDTLSRKNEEVFSAYLHAEIALSNETGQDPPDGFIWRSATQKDSDSR